MTKGNTMPKLIRKVSCYMDAAWPILQIITGVIIILTVAVSRAICGL